MILKGRLVPLEALRGIAVLVIVTQHVLLAFSPATSGLLAADRTETSIIGSSWFVLMNGPAAITFGFVLSGFVLCWALFTEGDTNRVARSFAKRLPRLGGLVILTTVGSYLLFRYGQYHFAEAAALSDSVWLKNFGFSGWTTDFEPSLEGALLESVATFFMPVYTYNGLLWTMQHALIGGLVVLPTAMLLSLSLGYRWATAGALAVLLVAVLLYTSFLFPFLAGAALSFVLSRYRPRLPMILALPVLGAGLYLLGFLLPMGTYTWVSQAPSALKDYAATLLHSAGSALVIVAVLCSAGLYRRLDRRIWWALGRISFPLFLVHPLVICSASSEVYLDLSAQGTGPAALLAAMFAVSFGLSILLSVPLAWLDHRWCAWLDETARQLFPDQAAQTAPAPPLAEVAPPRKSPAISMDNVVDLRPPPLARPMAPPMDVASAG
ncbi:MAG: acyltransferase [Rhodobacter sp.]|nr:acyltransferase [Rhodobacter sp.]